MNLSILIPTVVPRRNKLHQLLLNLEKQITNEVEVVIFEDNFTWSIGAKRNYLISQASGKFICFVDDDDEVHSEFCQILNDIIINNLDIDYIGWKTDFYYKRKIARTEERRLESKRGISHRNPLRREIALQCKFPPWNGGEDELWCKRIFPFIKKEFYIDESLYRYKYDPDLSLSYGKTRNIENNMKTSTINKKFAFCKYLKYIIFATNQQSMNY